jgi:hypothetical protein
VLEVSLPDRNGKSCGNSLVFCRQGVLRNPTSSLLPQAQSLQACEEPFNIGHAVPERCGTHFVRDPNTFFARSETASPRSTLDGA